MWHCVPRTPPRPPWRGRQDGTWLFSRAYRGAARASVWRRHSADSAVTSREARAAPSVFARKAASSAKPDRDFAGSRLRIGPRPECTARTAAIARPGPRRRSSGCARTRRAGRRSRCPSADAARPGYVIHVSARSSVGPRRRAGVGLARRPAGGAPGRSAAAAPCQASWGRTQLAADGCGDIMMAGVRVCHASRIGRSRLELGLGPAS